jgi:hypothetical protein
MRETHDTGASTLRKPLSPVAQRVPRLATNYKITPTPHFKNTAKASIVVVRPLRALNVPKVFRDSLVPPASWILICPD